MRCATQPPLPDGQHGAATLCAAPSPVSYLSGGIMAKTRQLSGKAGAPALGVYLDPEEVAAFGGDPSVTWKECSRCGVSGPLHSTFTPNKGAADGHFNQCTRCRCLGDARRRRNLLRADVEWRENERKRARRVNREHRHKWVKPSRSSKKARQAVANAIRAGTLVPDEFCADCGHDFSDFKRHGHHPDYSSPLSVVWLCTLCHKARHAK